MLARTLVLGAFLLAGCGDDDVRPSGVAFVDAPPGACVGPLAGFCEGRSCPSFAESVADLEERAAQGGCVVAEQGSCGALRYTAFSSGFFGFTAWFDGATLVAGTRFNDVPEFCDDTAHSAIYGPIPACEKVRTVTYCDPR